MVADTATSNVHSYVRHTTSQDTLPMHGIESTPSSRGQSLSKSAPSGKGCNSTAKKYCKCCGILYVRRTYWIHCDISMLLANALAVLHPTKNHIFANTSVTFSKFTTMLITISFFKQYPTGVTNRKHLSVFVDVLVCSVQLNIFHKYSNIP